MIFIRSRCIAVYHTPKHCCDDVLHRHSSLSTRWRITPVALWAKYRNCCFSTIDQSPHKPLQLLCAPKKYNATYCLFKKVAIDQVLVLITAVFPLLIHHFKWSNALAPGWGCDLLIRHSCLCCAFKTNTGFECIVSIARPCGRGFKNCNYKRGTHRSVSPWPLAWPVYF